MAPFTDLSPLLCLVYALAGPGMLAAMLALVALVRPNRRGFNAVVVLSLAPLLLGGLLVYALMWPESAVFREIVLASFSSLCVLAGLAALTVVLALAALVRPHRALRRAGLAALVVTVVVCGFIDPPSATSCTSLTEDPTAALMLAADGETIVDPDDLGDQPRGTAAWERALRHAIDSQVQYSENTGRPVPPPTVVAVIDRAAPIARVRRYLRIVALNDINEILLVTRRPDVASTRTLGAIRVDKMCSLGTVRLSAGLGFLDGYTTWGDFIRATHE
jgi:hypothetical protein